MHTNILDLIARVMELCGEPQASVRGPGHPPTETMRVLAALRRFRREGTPWRSLRATDDLASGSTLCRCMTGWAKTGLPRRVHRMLVGLLSGGCELIVDSCWVRTKRGGELTGPNPTDRSKMDTKYHIATTEDGIPVACEATTANVNDTLIFKRLVLAGVALLAKVKTVFADKGYDAEGHRTLCRVHGVEPRIHKRKQPHGSGLGKRRWPVERTNAWLLENKRLGLRYDRLGSIVQTLLQAACILVVAPRLAREL